jgi:hypothetical protein
MTISECNTGALQLSRIPAGCCKLILGRISNIEGLMKHIACYVLLAGLMSLAADASQRSAFDSFSKPESVKVRILAISTSIRSRSGNQEVYLGDIMLTTGQHRLVKMIDNYPDYESRISVNLLQEQPLLKMKVVRDPSCDSTGGTFFLPSDESQLFDATARTSLAGSHTDAVQCFRINHRTIQVIAR